MNNRSVYVTGAVLINTPLLSDDIFDYGFNDAKAVLVHELGHVLGPAHVTDPTQIMYAYNEGYTDLGEGDLRGFAAVGKGPCEPDL